MHSTKRELDKEETILAINQHLRSAVVKLKQVHDGNLHSLKDGIAALQTEIRQAYDLSEKLEVNQ